MTSSDGVTVVVAEDQPLLRAGLVMLLLGGDGVQAPAVSAGPARRSWRWEPHR